MTAKGHIGLWMEMIDRYTKPGDWVLDPMAGIGTTMVAAMSGRNVICNELEQHFIDPMVASREKLLAHGPMLGYSLGQVVVVRGDARYLPLAGWADGIVTSPPFESVLQGKGDIEKYAGERPHRKGQGYSDNATNIGNLRNAAYWDAMRRVYAEYYRVLRPAGVMALVVKGFTRDGKYIDLPAQTAELIESLGFKVFDQWARELWALSFWRVLQKRKSPETFDDRLRYEFVIAARK